MASNYCIYMHKNKINGKVYIGQSCNINVRWHPSSYQSSSYFFNAIQKYGWENFEHIILEDNLTINEADEKEQYYIKFYKSLNRNYGYNLKTGGNAGYHLSKETKEKMRQSNKKFYQNHQEDFIEKLEKAHKAARKKVICLNNNKIFLSQIEAAKYAGLKNSTPISRCCSGERKTTGKDPETEERLFWKFYEKEENEL